MTIVEALQSGRNCMIVMQNLWRKRTLFWSGGAAGWRVYEWEGDEVRHLLMTLDEAEAVACLMGEAPAPD